MNEIEQDYAIAVARLGETVLNMRLLERDKGRLTKDIVNLQKEATIVKRKADKAPKEDSLEATESGTIQE